MDGLHLLAEFRSCRCDFTWLCDVALLQRFCLDEARLAGLNPVGELFHGFEPCGVTGVVLLAESHLALHTWPEFGTVTLDVYVCNHRRDASESARRLMAALQARFEPQQVLCRELRRGDVSQSTANSVQP
jgi:S-adenosylmethionine decarboxylase